MHEIYRMSYQDYPVLVLFSLENESSDAEPKLNVHKTLIFCSRRLLNAVYPFSYGCVLNWQSFRINSKQFFPEQILIRVSLGSSVVSATFLIHLSEKHTLARQFTGLLSNIYDGASCEII